MRVSGILPSASESAIQPPNEEQTLITDGRGLLTWYERCDARLFEALTDNIITLYVDYPWG